MCVYCDPRYMSQTVFLESEIWSGVSLAPGVGTWPVRSDSKYPYPLSHSSFQMHSMNFMPSHHLMQGMEYFSYPVASLDHFSLNTQTLDFGTSYF